MVMKSDSLLKSTMLSDTRKGILYLLLDGPGSLTDIKSHFKVTSASIIPRIKDLVNADLVVKEDGKYRLTTTGAILANKLRRLDDLERVIEQDGAYLNSHDLSPIPQRLIGRIGELGNCMVIRNEMDNITATHDEIYGRLPKSKKVMGISPVFDPDYPKIYLGLAKRGISVSLIITGHIFTKVEKEYASFLKEYLSYANARMYIVDDVRLVLVATNEFLSMYLYNKNGTFDSMSSLFSPDKSAAKWGAELFEEYLCGAREVHLK
jgi:predicted transcriptional regulator